MILDDIIRTKQKEVATNKQNISFSYLDKAIAQRKKYIDFRKAIENQKKIVLLAEIKKASPSCGIIRKDFNHLEIARIYEEEGVGAISVLTDKQYFQGDIEYLSEIKKLSALPLLRKDFIIDEYQILESAAFGADAVLLIASVLSKEKIKKLSTLATSLRLSPLLEIHDKNNLDKISEANTDIIGINNRNLKTFEIDLKTTENLLPYIPKGKIIVSESGINTIEDIKYLSSLNVKACLIGESLMRENNLRKKLKELNPHFS